MEEIPLGQYKILLEQKKKLSTLLTEQRETDNSNLTHACHQPTFVFATSSFQVTEHFMLGPEPIQFFTQSSVAYYNVRQTYSLIY